MDSDKNIISQIWNLKTESIDIEEPHYHPEAEKISKIIDWIFSNYPGCGKNNRDSLNFNYYTFSHIGSLEINISFGILTIFLFEFDDLVEKDPKGKFNFMLLK